MFGNEKVVITSGIHDVKSMDKKLEEKYSNWGLKINCDKTENLRTYPPEFVKIMERYLEEYTILNIWDQSIKQTNPVI